VVSTRGKWEKPGIGVRWRVVYKSRFMPCPECGASVDRTGPVHECSPERRADYQVFGLRHEVAQLEIGLRRYLRTTSGVFESWVAARQVRDHT
jgi:hypothetical protein